MPQAKVSFGGTWEARAALCRVCVGGAGRGGRQEPRYLLRITWGAIQTPNAQTTLQIPIKPRRLQCLSPPCDSDTQPGWKPPPPPPLRRIGPAWGELSQAHGIRTPGPEGSGVGVFGKGASWVANHFRVAVTSLSPGITEPVPEFSWSVAGVWPWAGTRCLAAVLKEATH